jgi:hypothetical protein
LHHAWINHGIELCRIAFILIDAKDPLQAFRVPNPGGLA